MPRNWLSSCSLSFGFAEKQIQNNYSLDERRMTCYYFYYLLYSDLDFISQQSSLLEAAVKLSSSLSWQRSCVLGQESGEYYRTLSSRKGGKGKGKGYKGKGDKGSSSSSSTANDPYGYF